MHQKKKNGFTLLELLVATTLSAVLLLAVSSVFMTFLMSSARTTIRRQVHSEGNEIRNRIEFLLRNSKVVTSTCTGGNIVPIVFTTLDGNVVEIGTDGVDSLYTKLGTGTATDLTTAETKASGVKFVCSEDITTKIRVVTIQFTLTKTSDGVSASETFQSIVELRNS